MTILIQVPRAVRGPLSVNLPATAVPTGITRLRITINRFNWPAGTGVLQATLEFSLDGGVTWPLGVRGFSADGGQISYKGNPDAPSGFEYPLPEPTNSQRKVRGSVTLTTSLDCSAVIEGF